MVLPVTRVDVDAPESWRFSRGNASFKKLVAGDGDRWGVPVFFPTSWESCMAFAIDAVSRVLDGDELRRGGEPSMTDSESWDATEGMHAVNCSVLLEGGVKKSFTVEGEDVSFDAPEAFLGEDDDRLHLPELRLLLRAPTGVLALLETTDEAFGGVEGGVRGLEAVLMFRIFSGWPGNQPLFKTVIFGDLEFRRFAGPVMWSNRLEKMSSSLKAPFSKASFSDASVGSMGSPSRSIMLPDSSLACLARPVVAILLDGLSSLDLFVCLLATGVCSKSIIGRCEEAAVLQSINLSN